MFEASVLHLVYITLAVSTGLLVKWWYVPLPSRPYPPGPKPRFISGNLGQLPRTFPWLKYTEWAKQYGSLIYLKAFTNHIVIVNTVEDANEIYEKRSSLYSDRPIVPMVELMGWDFSTPFLKYGEKWRRHRRLYTQNLNKTAIRQNSEPTQLVKVQECLRRLFVAPDDFMDHFRHLAASIIMATVYDKTMSESEIEGFAKIAEAAMDKLSGGVVPGKFAVDTLPFLRYLPAWSPGASFKRYAAECRVLVQQMQDGPLQYVKKRLAAGFEVSSLVSTLLERKGDGDELEKEIYIKSTAATIFAGGSETSVSTLATFLYAMVVNPDAQKKAQHEIDALVGMDRLPDFDDRPYLPYVEAIYRELMRWQPIAPLAFAHIALEDDVYKDYFIPKGTNVIPNIWAMTHDEQRYPQPDSFLPERFFDRDGKLNHDDTILVFGFGRRVCPGRHMANSTIWLVIVNMLATFNIQKAKDKQGNEIPADGSYSDGLIRHKLPFHCSITPRSEEAQKLILDAQSHQD